MTDKTPLWATSNPLGPFPYSTHRYWDGIRAGFAQPPTDALHLHPIWGCGQVTFYLEAALWGDTCGACSVLKNAVHKCWGKASSTHGARLDRWETRPINQDFPLLGSPWKDSIEIHSIRLSWRSHSIELQFPTVPANSLMLPTLSSSAAPCQDRSHAISSQAFAPASFREGLSLW